MSAVGKENRDARRGILRSGALSLSQRRAVTWSNPLASTQLYEDQEACRDTVPYISDGTGLHRDGVLYDRQGRRRMRRQEREAAAERERENAEQQEREDAAQQSRSPSVNQEKVGKGLESSSKNGRGKVPAAAGVRPSGVVGAQHVGAGDTTGKHANRKQTCKPSVPVFEHNSTPTKWMAFFCPQYPQGLMVSPAALARLSAKTRRPASF